MTQVNCQRPTANFQDVLGVGSWRFGSLSAIVLLSFALIACRQDMHDSPRYIPLRASDFFTDGSSVRMPVANTVSRNPLSDGDELFYTGRVNGELSNMFPMAVTADVLA